MKHIAGRKRPYPQDEGPIQRALSDALFRDTESEDTKPLPKGIHIPKSVLGLSDPTTVQQLDRHLQQAQTHLVNILATLMPFRDALYKGAFL